MSELNAFTLTPIFQAVGEMLEENRSQLNALDTYNANHGDHLIAVFKAATQAAKDTCDRELGESMAAAGKQLKALRDNESAQIYSNGLGCLAEQFGQRRIQLDELVAYVGSVLMDRDDLAPARSGEVLKALVAGIADWNRLETGQSAQGNALNMGALFDFGIAYLQAKQRGGTRLDVLADTAAMITPLGREPYRYESGKLVMGALLNAFTNQAGGLSQADGSENCLR